MTVYISHVSGPRDAHNCPPNTYRCSSLEPCIHMEKLCDGVNDCLNSADEGEHCSKCKLCEFGYYYYYYLQYSWYLFLEIMSIKINE